MCRRLAGNDADAADATQEAMLAIVRGLDRFDGRARFATWAYRVATNACLDELRRRSRRPDPGLPEVERAPVGQRGADDGVVDRLTIDQALAALPEDFRVVIVLRDQLGMDYAEIGEALDLAPGTVRSRIARGRGRLATLLAPAEDDGNRPPPSRRQTPRND